MTRYQNSGRKASHIDGADPGAFAEDRAAFLAKGIEDGTIVLMCNDEGHQVHATNSVKSLRKWEIDGYKPMVFVEKTVKVAVSVAPDAVPEPVKPKRARASKKDAGGEA